MANRTNRNFSVHILHLPGEMNGNVFLKGYQWPFDARKVIGGSSLIDLLVYIETMVKRKKGIPGLPSKSKRI